jgi:MoxR-vWA-beta-propeller ternary system domain bpX4
MTSNYFYDSITGMRLNEEMVLYNNIPQIKVEDEQLVLDFLRIEYEIESKNYPFIAPDFNGEAAIWAAKLVYVSSQLMLYRESKAEDLDEILPKFTFEISTSAIVSADLCLRFLPIVISETKHIDMEDELIEKIEEQLKSWPFSNVGGILEIEKNSLDVILSNNCIAQLFIDRIILKKDLGLSKWPAINLKIKETMGDYSTIYWKEFNN